MKSIRNQHGFSMIEIVIVTAIVGALVSIAVPSYQGFVAKAHQGEARAHLAGIFTSEQSFYSEWHWYTLCLWQTGYAPDGQDFYYLTGFMNATSTFANEGKYSTDPLPANSNCNLGASVSWNNTNRNDATFENNHIVRIGASGGTLTADHYDTWDGANPGFKAVAWGSISNSDKLDIWTIREDKSMTNLQSGL